MSLHENDFAVQRFGRNPKEQPQFPRFLLLSILNSRTRLNCAIAIVPRLKPTPNEYVSRVSLTDNRGTLRKL
jgi:hypothetical protein